VELSKLLVELFVESHATPPSELVLDFDATDDPVHGHQAGRFFHGYYDHYCFLPLYVFCGGQLLVAYLRPANIDAAKHSRAILKLLVARLRQAWPGVKIILRGDSGFCRWKTLRWFDRAFAYVLVEHVRRTALAGTELARAQVSTIRTKLLKIGARVRTSVRRVVLHLSASYPLAELFRQVARTLVSPLPRPSS
jgi:hypothetical protein